MRAIIASAFVALAVAKSHKKDHKKIDWQKLVEEGLKAAGQVAHSEGSHAAAHQNGESTLDEQNHIHIDVSKILGDAQQVAQIYSTIRGEEAKAAKKTAHKKSHKKIDWEKLIEESLKAAGKLPQGGAKGGAHGGAQGNNEFALEDEQNHIHIDVSKILGDAQQVAQIYSTIRGEEAKSHKKVDWEKIIEGAIKQAKQFSQAEGSHAAAHQNGESTLDEQNHIHIDVSKILGDAQQVAQIYSTIRGEEEKKEHEHVNWGKLLGESIKAANALGGNQEHNFLGF